MTFQDRKDKGQNWDKIKAKREELNSKNEELANEPKAVLKQDQESKQKKES